jgi:hypothetical protein
MSRICYDYGMAFFRKGSSRTRELLGRIGLSVTIVFGFLSIIFSRDFSDNGALFHDQASDNGVAHADVPVGSSSAGSSGGDSTGSSSDSGGDSGGSGGSGGGG